MSDRTIAERLAVQRARIEAAALACGRDPKTVQIVAASKRQSVASIREAYAAGQRDFGENYVQELVRKAEELSDLGDIRWHMIGHLQSNKCKMIVDLAHRVHTVSTLKLVTHLGKRVAQSASDKRPLSVLIEVNVTGEASKSGCVPEAAIGILDAIDAHESLVATGLMTMPMASENSGDATAAFERLVNLRDKLGGAVRLPELSMGMSRDAEEAVKAGATFVRLGTAIFGPRPL